MNETCQLCGARRHHKTPGCVHFDCGSYVCKRKNLVRGYSCLETEIRTLRALNVELAERVAAQSELLSRKAEKSHG